MQCSTVPFTLASAALAPAVALVFANTTLLAFVALVSFADRHLCSEGNCDSLQAAANRDSLQAVANRDHSQPSANCHPRQSASAASSPAQHTPAYYIAAAAADCFAAAATDYFTATGRAALTVRGMREIAHEVSAWLDAGEAVALVTVIHAEGPSPRPVGAHMAISASGRLAGSVSGGCVEGAVAREAEELLAGGGPPRRLRYSARDEDGWEVGLACGGAIEIYLELLTPLHRRLLKALRADETVALVTCLDGGGHTLAWPDGRVEGEAALAPDPLSLFASSSLAELRSGPQGACFVQVFGPPPTLTVIGAVHLAQPLVRLAQELGFRVRVADGRRLFATRERFPTADELLVAWPRQVLTPQYLRPQDAVVILTHDPKFDLPALELALNSPVGYVGLLGSRTTQERRRAAFEARGGRAEQWARVHGPVGLDLGGQEPAEIALAILAEIVAARHGKA